MGHHKGRHRPPYGGRDLPPQRRFRDDRGYDDRGYDDGPYDNGDYGPYRTTRHGRIPVAVTLAALAVWTLLAFGAWVVVDPLLVWAGGLVAPVLDVGSAVGGVVGMGKEVGAVIEASRAEGIAMWLLGVLGWLAKPAIVIGWALGAVAILIAPGLLRRARGAGLSRFLH
jgi:hypothetical protein